MDAETREELDVLYALTGALFTILTEAMIFIRDTDPERFEFLLRSRRLLVQTAEQGTFHLHEGQISKEVLLRSHRDALALLEQVAAQSGDNPD